MNQLAQPTTMFYMNITLMPIILLEAQAMIAFLLMLLYFTNKTKIATKILCLVIPILGRNGISIFSGAMKT